MRLTVLSSGSGGNAALVRAGETCLLVDAGLTGAEMEQRLDQARVGSGQIDHVLVTHGHLDHARSAGKIARSHAALLHCAPSLMENAALRRARRFSSLPINARFALTSARNELEVEVESIELPHDAQPTVAFRIEHAGKALAIVTDMGQADRAIARRLRGVDVLVLEFNHDPELLESGPYPAPLKRRIAGPRGHLSNQAAQMMLRWCADATLHTLVLAHLSETNNSPELARQAAHETLEQLGLAARVRVIVAEQDRVLETIDV